MVVVVVVVFCVSFSSRYLLFFFLFFSLLLLLLCLFRLKIVVCFLTIIRIVFLRLQVPTCPMCSQKRNRKVLNSSPTDIWFFIAFLSTVIEDSVVLEL